MQKNIMPGCEQTKTHNFNDSPGGTVHKNQTSGTFVITSGPQYPRAINVAGIDSVSDPALSESKMIDQYEDIAALRATTDGFVPIIINGDLTNSSRIEERFITQHKLTLLQSGTVPTGWLFFPGLGDHDYVNNIGECANNGCARDSVCDLLQWVRGIKPTNFDYSYSEPLHKGSLSYSVDVGNIHFIQLNNEPTYSNYFETGGNIPSKPKMAFDITPSLDWLRNNLSKARKEGRIIILSLHKPSAWARNVPYFPSLLKYYQVTAVFFDNNYNNLGNYTSGYLNFGATPAFHNGATFAGSYLIATYDMKSMKMKIFKVKAPQTYANKELVQEITMLAGTDIPYIEIQPQSWSSGFKESSFAYVCPYNQIMIGRNHYGNENKDTAYQCAIASSNNTIVNLKNASWGEWIKESSNTAYTCPENKVMTGREHRGDANGNTRYQCANATLDKILIKVDAYNWSVDFKEPSHEFACSTGQIMIGRVHSGDANGTTKYRCGAMGL